MEEKLLLKVIACSMLSSLNGCRLGFSDVKNVLVCVALDGAALWEMLEGVVSLGQSNLHVPWDKDLILQQNLYKLTYARIYDFQGQFNVYWL